MCVQGFVKSDGDFFRRVCQVWLLCHLFHLPTVYKQRMNNSYDAGKGSPASHYFCRIIILQIKVSLEKDREES